MELMYPIMIIICLILALAICFVKFNKKIKYTNGKKVANTKYVKETEYYKLKIKRYKILTNSIKILSVILIIVTSILIARPVKVQTKSEEKYNRDIFMSLDISTSQDEVNLELIRKFKKIIPNIKGDRIGIVIYNTAPVVYCPLTDDYDYINEYLDILEKNIKLSLDYDGHPPVTTEINGQETVTVVYGGAIAHSVEKGSSLIGDGLARNNFFISRC